MEEQQIRFDDGAAYEKFMGVWSRSVGDIFLDWLAPPPGLEWIDVGCGNGAFTEAILARCAPAEVAGIDPSEAQIAYARTRPACRQAEFRQGDGMALPFADKTFDIAAMGLVIFFFTDPAKGVSELVRVTRPGGLVATFAWDMIGGGFPLEPVFTELRALGKTPLLPPSPEASQIDNLRALWTGAGLQEVETREITVQRTFADFDEFWSINLLGPTFRPLFQKMSSDEVERLKTKLRTRLPTDSSGRISYASRANAVKGGVGR